MVRSIYPQSVILRNIVCKNIQISDRLTDGSYELWLTFEDPGPLVNLLVSEMDNTRNIQLVAMDRIRAKVVKTRVAVDARTGVLVSKAASILLSNSKSSTIELNVYPGEHALEHIAATKPSMCAIVDVTFEGMQVHRYTDSKVDELTDVGKVTCILKRDLTVGSWNN